MGPAIDECNREWLLKNSDFDRNGQNPGDVKCLEIREDRLKRFLTQFCFCDFRLKEFFNSHAGLQQSATRLAVCPRSSAAHVIKGL